MKIIEIRLSMLRVPLRTPFRTALREVDSVEDIVVTVHTDDGHIGYGEAPPTAAITGETHASIIAAVRRHIAPRLIGEDIADLNRVVGLIQSALEKNTSAKAAAEIAIYDLWAQYHGAPLYQLLGGGHPRLSTDLTISVNDVDTMVADALNAIARGYTSLKIKIGKKIDDDIVRVRAIHTAVGESALLRLDANQGWTAAEAVRAIRQLEDAGVRMELVEQPVKAHDLEGLRHVTRHVDTPIMADESAFGPKDLLELIRLRAADIVNIKLMKTGGISGALRMADIATMHGMECMIGCMLESSISVAAAVHVAVARSNVITKIDLDGPSLCTFNPVDGGVDFDESHLSIPPLPGLGIRSVHGLEPL
ncbi:MAG: dipeptide epimerase [Luteibacter sp.]|uniref:dipeptide epimerase n=1 Tax=Luteibacter sp. TaxID=1886636 RepID=UPI002807FED4|nr:dipeptide epimerase [Luteibacter sp.]MDQ7997883.1 dipeptide epimerase [Luteibacter sp.]MDQ8050374.1 dipeptide epimerase [Luteibacter sp.]